MEITKNPTVAAVRTRALSTCASPFAQRAAVGAVGAASGWRVTSALDVPSYMRGAALPVRTNHNSILSTVVVPVPAGRGGFGADKQAAPPRGVPR